MGIYTSAIDTGIMMCVALYITMCYYMYVKSKQICIICYNCSNKYQYWLIPVQIYNTTCAKSTCWTREILDRFYYKIKFNSIPGCIHIQNAKQHTNF